MSNDASAAIRDVIAERQRQVHGEGWTPAHDDTHAAGELAKAAAAYAFEAHTPSHMAWLPPAFWPWARSWWKPGDARRMLVKAAALLIAEIERLDRGGAAARRPRRRPPHLPPRPKAWPVHPEAIAAEAEA